MITGKAFQITRARTEDLCAQLDCEPVSEEMDDALADAGYARLDHGSDPGPVALITPYVDAIGKDPGHRASATTLALAMSHVIHAETKPPRERFYAMVEKVLEEITTDALGEHLVSAIASYAASRDPGLHLLNAARIHDPAPVTQAKITFDAIRIGNVVSDIALERVIAVGAEIAGWQSLVEGNIRLDEPIVRLKRHDASDYESKGIPPQLAELIAWIRANPTVDVDTFENYAQFIGVDPREAGMDIQQLMRDRPQLIENGGPSSTT